MTTKRPQSVFILDVDSFTQSYRLREKKIMQGERFSDVGSRIVQIKSKYIFSTGGRKSLNRCIQLWYDESECIFKFKSL